MKILHIVDSGGIYGKEQVIINLIKELKNDHSLTLFGTGKPDLVEFIADETEAKFFTSSFEMVKTVLKTQSEYDIIHLHSYKESILLSVPKIVRLLRTPTVRTIHGHTSKGKSLFSKIRLYEFLDKLSLHFHNVIIGVSTEMYADHIIKNGISDFESNHSDLPDHFRENITSFNIVIGCAARLSKEKNVESLIRAIPILAELRSKSFSLSKESGIKLYIFGSGKELNILEDLVREQNMEPGKNNLDEIYLMGYVNNIRDYLGLLDIYIQPSLTEGTPMAVLEAMAAEQFTITTYVGGMKHFVDEGATATCGISATSIANNIFEVLGEQKEKTRREISRKARKLFRQEYCSRVMSKKYLQVYKEIFQTNKKHFKKSQKMLLPKWIKSVFYSVVVILGLILALAGQTVKKEPNKFQERCIKKQISFWNGNKHSQTFLKNKF